MKIAFLITNEVFESRLMDALTTLGIDYYTRWEHVKGKGHGTDPHLGTRSFPGINDVLMIAFEDEEVLEKLVVEVKTINEGMIRSDDKIRLFQMPLERIV